MTDCYLLNSVAVINSLKKKDNCYKFITGLFSVPISNNPQYLLRVEQTEAEKGRRTPVLVEVIQKRLYRKPVSFIDKLFCLLLIKNV